MKESFDVAPRQDAPLLIVFVSSINSCSSMEPEPSLSKDSKQNFRISSLPYMQYVLSTCEGSVCTESLVRQRW